MTARGQVPRSKPAAVTVPRAVAPEPGARLPNSVLARAAARGAPAAALTQPRALQAVLARRPAPPSLDALTAKVKKAPVGGKGQRDALVALWIKEMGKLLAGVKDTGAAREAEVLDNERGELEGHRKHLQEAADNLKGEDFRDAVLRLTRVKAAELGLELTHDVIVRAGEAGWSTDDLSHVDEALSGLPSGWNPGTGNAITFAPVDEEAKDDTGGVTDVDNVITMHRRGMRGKDYKDDCPALKGLTTHKQSIRHEIGHTIHNRMRATADKLFALLDWKEYSLGNDLHRQALQTETGLDDTKFASFLAGLSKSRKVQGKRTYMKAASGLVHSFGKPAELPEGKEFDYAYWSQSEYFPEIYAYLINAPALMASKLSKAQLDWWRDNIFGGTLPA